MRRASCSNIYGILQPHPGKASLNNFAMMSEVAFYRDVRGGMEFTMSQGYAGRSIRASASSTLASRGRMWTMPHFHEPDRIRSFQEGDFGVLTMNGV